MIKCLSGNIFKSEAEALINTVNTKGVMGKGIALQFKQSFPNMFKEKIYAALEGINDLNIELYQPSSDFIFEHEFK